MVKTLCFQCKRPEFDPACHVVQPKQKSKKNNKVKSWQFPGSPVIRNQYFHCCRPGSKNKVFKNKKATELHALKCLKW